MIITNNGIPVYPVPLGFMKDSFMTWELSDDWAILISMSRSLLKSRRIQADPNVMQNPRISAL